VHGGFVYMTPMRPRHYRVYSQVGQCFWCCVGTGMENHGKYGRFVYAHTDDALYVNLYVSATVNWREKHVGLEQKTGLPEDAGSMMRLFLDEPQQFALKLRWPAWVKQGEFEVRVNGEPQEVEGEPSSYVALDRLWKNGDLIEVKLPMRVHLEQLPDGSDYAAIFYGPVVLAAVIPTEEPKTFVADDGRFAHIPRGKELPLDEAPRLVGELDEIAPRVYHVGDDPITFSVADVIEPAEFQSLELVPFYRVHDTRYMIYWRLGDR
jgi:uncharacterized protein